MTELGNEGAERLEHEKEEQMLHEIHAVIDQGGVGAGVKVKDLDGGEGVHAGIVADEL